MSLNNAVPPRPTGAPYDKDLQMFKSEAVVNARKLNWVRWLVEQGRLEHVVYGPPSGDYAEAYDPTSLEPSNN